MPTPLCHDALRTPSSTASTESLLMLWGISMVYRSRTEQFSVNVERAGIEAHINLLHFCIVYSDLAQVIVALLLVSLSSIATFFCCWC